MKGTLTSRLATRASVKIINNEAQGSGIAMYNDQNGNDLMYLSGMVAKKSSHDGLRAL